MIRVQGGLKFSVEHYAGSVIYDANSFVSKNKDLLKPELQAVQRHAPLAPNIGRYSSCHCSF
jgi:myosin heavy subunit